MKRLTLLSTLACFLLLGGHVCSQSRMQQLYSQAFQYQRQYKPDSALICIEAMLSIDSTFVPAWNLKGYLYEESYADYDRARQCYERALSIDPQYLKGYINLGHLHYLKREYEEAEKLVRKTLEIDSNYADAYFNLGLMANEQHYLREAFVHMRKAAELGSKPAKLWLENNDNDGPMQHNN